MKIEEAIKKMNLPDFNTWPGRAARSCAVAALYHSRKAYGWKAYEIARACAVEVGTVRMYASLKKDHPDTSRLMGIVNVV